MISYRLPRWTCRSCGAVILFVRNERKLGKVFPIDAIPSDCSNPLATLGRVRPELVGRQIDVVRFVPSEDRHKYRYLYVPHHVTCPEAGDWKYRSKPRKTPAEIYQGEIEGLLAWRESRGRA